MPAEAEVAALLAADDRRRALMLAGDADGLAALLSERLVHVHANGRADRKPAYLASIRRTPDAYLRVDRSEAQAIVAGDAGWISAVQDTEIARDGRHTVARMRVLSVWTRDGGDWRMEAFSATRSEA